MEFLHTQIRFLFCQRNLLIKQKINKIHRLIVPSELDGIKKTLFPLLNTDYPSQDLCLNIRNDIINKHSITEHAVDIKILEIFMLEQKYETATVYFRCLKSKNYPLSNFVLIKYLELLSANPKKISNVEEEEILHICDVIKKEYDHIPSVILSTCIQALCLTSKWETIFELITCNDIEDINFKVISFVVLAAFRNGKPNIGFEFLDRIEYNYRNMYQCDYIYNEYLNYFTTHKNDELNDAIEKMFHFWRKHDIIPNKSIINIFVDACQKLGWEAHPVQITPDGQCDYCHNHLSPLVLQNNFHKLFKSVLSKVIIGDDIFQKTTPSEFYQFNQFIDKTKPYDIVIDGLNIAYSIKQNFLMYDTVLQLPKKYNKILVITRKHHHKSMKWLLQLNNVVIYYLNDITEDDPYILYAALASGIKTKFLSLDQQRQHYHKLKNVNLQKAFIRWQFSHQYTWTRVDSKKSALIDPISYNPFPQVKNGLWHISYRESNKSLHRPPTNWVCLHRPRK